MSGIDPLCIILVKSGAHGGRLLVRYPYSDTACQEVTTTRTNPYSLVAPTDDLLVISEGGCRSNIRNGQLYGFSDETLVNILAVSNCLCDAKFELKVNDVRFVGHPLVLDQPSTKTTISMFHLVFAIPASASYSLILCYHDFSKIISLALRHEEYRVGYLSQQAASLLGARDEVESEWYDTGLASSQLAQEIQRIHHQLCREGEVRQYINKWVEVSFCLPQKLHCKYFPDILATPELIYQCLENMKPYHALILLEDKQTLLDSLSTDASSALRRLITLASPEKSLKTLAVDLDLSLMQVFQLTGHLLYWGRVTLIYPLCENNQYVVSPSLVLPIPLHIKNKFSQFFPTENIHSVLSLFSLPRKIILPPTHNNRQDIFMDMVIFLLRQHMITQIHTYLWLNNNKHQHTTHTQVKFQIGTPISDNTEETIKADDITNKTKENNDMDDILKNLSDEDRDAILSVPASKNPDELNVFIDLSKYFDGNHHLEEIMYHENIGRGALVQIIDKFRTILIKHEHEDPAISMYFKQMGHLGTQSEKSVF